MTERQSSPASLSAEALSHGNSGPLRLGGLGLVLPTFAVDRAELPSARHLASVAAEAERAGATGIWSCDHLFWRTPLIECLSSLAVAATSTQGSVLGASVLQVPLRSAPVIAKQAGSLQQLSNGRLVLGVGVGSHEPEYAEAGATFRSRGRRLDAAIAELRRLWDGGHGRPGYAQLPVPDPAIPVFVGGSSPRALARAAAAGDGWIANFVDPEEYSAHLAVLEDIAEASGKDPTLVRRLVLLFVSVGGEDPRGRGLAWMSALYGLPEKAFGRHLVHGSPGDCAARIGEYVEAGAEHVVVFYAGDDPLAPFSSLALASRKAELFTAGGADSLSSGAVPHTGDAAGGSTNMTARRRTPALADRLPERVLPERVGSAYGTAQRDR